MDESLYNTRNEVLILHQLLELIEDMGDEQDTNVDIFVILPEDETEQDSDNSDDEHEANLNHLGPNMLQTECIIQKADHNDSDSSDDFPLSKYPKIDEPSSS
ncbi:hypothetical protein FQA39_LY01626 [Lamprigera yunnana]|nr:hypothetical protein FQA39_LY01626 [Lamprigera yunnana]